MATYSAPIMAVGLASGLTGTLGYTIKSVDGVTTLAARSTDGVREIGSTGTYVAEATIDTAWIGIVEWDAGAGVLAVGSVGPALATRDQGAVAAAQATTAASQATLANTRVQTALPNAAPGASGGLARVQDLPEGASVGAIAAAVVSALTVLPSSQPAQQYAARTVIKANDYGTSARSFLVPIAAGAEWPPDLSDGWEFTFVASRNTQGNDTAGEGEWEGEVAVVTPTGDARAVRVSFAGTETAELPAGKYDYSVRATKAEAASPWTLELGIITLKDDPANVPTTP